MDTTTTKRTAPRQAGPEAIPPASAAAVFVCAECRHAQLFAVQPRVLCTCHGSPTHGEVLYAGRPACAQVLPRKHADPAPRPAPVRRGRRRRSDEIDDA